jgi:3-phenylpropionate/cinnamic acid dioxygenase small subunit
VNAPAPDAVQAMIDELAVRNVLARIAQLADTGDLDEYLMRFAPDASWEMPGAPARSGHADLRQGAVERRASGMQGPGTGTRHVLTTTAVTIDGDTATARSYWMFLADTTTQPTIRLTGQYDDVLRRSSTGWQMARRAITMG